MSRRILIHVQHLMGIGHQRRMAAIARALAAREGVQVHYVTGGFPVTDLDTGACTVHPLPAARVRDGDFSRLVGEGDREVDEAWRAHRRARLLALLERLQPALIVTETFPFGRGLLRFELEPLLHWADSRGVLLVGSVRDIIEPRSDTAKLAAMARLARRHYRALLVHGDERVLPFSTTFAPWRDIADLIVHTGYVVEPPTAAAGVAARDGPVLVSCGGGRVGEGLLRAALQARSLCRVCDRPWELRVGQSMDAPWIRALTRAVPAGVRISANRRGFVDDLAGAAVSVSQAGYNTVAEVLASRVRSVLVPYAGEQEQTLRARAFAGRGLARMVEAAALTPQRLAQAVDEAVAAAAPALEVRLDGIANSVQHIIELLEQAGRAARDGTDTAMGGNG